MSLKIIQWQVSIQSQGKTLSGQVGKAGWEGMSYGESYDPAEDRFIKSGSNK